MCKFVALEVFTRPNVNLLALLAEWVSLASPFVHQFDKGNVKSSMAQNPFMNAARCNRLVTKLQQDPLCTCCEVGFAISERCGLISIQDMSNMFGFKSHDGVAQKPLVLQPGYTAGYVAIAHKSMCFGFSARAKFVWNRHCHVLCELHCAA